MTDFAQVRCFGGPLHGQIRTLPIDCQPNFFRSSYPLSGLIPIVEYGIFHHKGISGWTRHRYIICGKRAFHKSMRGPE